MFYIYLTIFNFKCCIQLFCVTQIDVSVLIIMEDSSLAKYVPHLGDRIFLKHFCTDFNRRSQRCESDNKKRKMSLMEKLHIKLSASRSRSESLTDCTATDDFDASNKRFVNSNETFVCTPGATQSATKLKRNVEFG